MSKLTTADFIIKANIKHNNQYNYSKCNYVNGKTEITIICPDHGEFIQLPWLHLKGTACKECVKINKQKTCMIKYGVDSQFKDIGVQEKCKQTMLINHGVENMFQAKSFQQQKEITCLQKYGVEHPSQSETVQNKMQATNIIRHGVPYARQSKAIRDKTALTNLELYGHTNYLCGDEILNIRKQYNNIEHNLDISYNIKPHMINVLPLLLDKEWLGTQYQQYKKTVDIIADELNVSGFVILKYLKLHNIKINTVHTYSQISVQWLELIMQEQGIFIQHAGNIGEYKIPSTRYRVDGYHEDTNTVYEFYGDFFHGNPNVYLSDYYNKQVYKTMGELYQKTINREQEIIELGYNLITVWEYDYVNNKK